VSAPCGAEGSGKGAGSAALGSNGGGIGKDGSTFTLEATAFLLCNSATVLFIASAIGTRATPFALSTQPALANVSCSVCSSF
jgi:hypothetical protein